MSPKEKIEQFKHDMIKQYQFKPEQMNTLFDNFKPNQTVLHKIQNPYEAKPWPVYRQLFLSKKRIKQGKDYYKKHQAALLKAQKKYGVDPMVIVAIIGVESFYGQHVGRFPVFDSLATLAFYYPKRGQFFKRELENFLLLSREQHISLKMQKGSYAGAIGFAQFMPSSIRHYGRSINPNGPINLNTDDDAIVSIANYLKENGWKANQPIAQHVKFKGKEFKTYLSNNVKRFYNQQQLRQAGLISQLKAQRAAVIIMPRDISNNTWAVFNNFKSIMSYNPRTPYAMAVYQLSQYIKNGINKNG